MIPLAGESNLKRYFKSFQIREGHLEPVHDLLKVKAMKLEPKKRFVKLNFDSVRFKFEISYDSV